MKTSHISAQAWPSLLGGSSRAAVGGTGARKASTLPKALRRCTRRYSSQREEFHPDGFRRADFLTSHFKAAKLPA
jgi:hypothetical protein